MSRKAPVIVAATVGTAVLLGLGAWQWQRLQWKTDVIAQIEARRHAAVTSLPPTAAWSTLKPDDYEYRHVAVNGAFEPRTALVYRGGAPNAPGDGPGYLLLSPLRLPDNTVVIVNRGFAPLTESAPVRDAMPSGTVVLTGLMRSPEARNAFTPADDPAKGVWYTRDPAAIGAALGVGEVAPFTVDLDAVPKAQGWPRAGTTVVDIPNNHLSYALTWWGLATALIGVTAAYIRRSG